MQILIVSATVEETQPLLTSFQSDFDRKTRSTTLLVNGHEVDILITGVGMVATSYELGSKLSKRNGEYDLALNMGIAGSFDRNIDIGQVVNVSNDCFAELGAEDGTDFINATDLGLVTEKQLCPDNKGYHNRVFDKLKEVNGITVNKVHGNQVSIDEVIKRYNPQVETMEGAAFLYACGEADIPCVQLRAISNFIERRNADNWNIDLAITNLNDVVINTLNAIE